jgi:CARDB
MKKAHGWTILAVLTAAISVGWSQNPRQQAPKPALVRPDLIVTGIDIVKSHSGTDSGGKTYWVFDVTARIKNQGRGNAGGFKVLLERNNGAGGSWQAACPNCMIDMSGLDAGHEMTTPVKTFNNANGAPSRFRFTADSAGQVSESDESNNSREESFVALAIGEAVEGGMSQSVKPDLVAISVEYQQIEQYEAMGKHFIKFKAEARIKNAGSGASPSFEVLFRKGQSPYINEPLQSATVHPLAPNAEVVLSTDALTYEIGTPRVFVVFLIDPMNRVTEANKANNAMPESAFKAFPSSS